MWFFQEDIGDSLTEATRTYDFSSTLPPPFTLTRTAAALGRDNSGRWVSFAANQPRSWFNPTTLATPYTLIEPARTQLLYRTRQPTPTMVAATSTVDATVQTPFGAGSVKIVPSTTSATHGWNFFFGSASHGAALADNQTVALTATMKPSGAYTDISFFLLNRTNVYSSVRFSLSGAGTVVTSTGIISARITRDTDDFYTVEIINNYGAGTTSPSFNGGFHDQTGTRTFAGDGTSGIYLAYVGAEIGTEATSPIINTGTTSLTRPEDVVTSSADWIESGPKSLGITYIPLGRTVGSVLAVSGTDRIDLRNDASSVSFNATVNSLSAVAISGAAPSAGDLRTVVVSMAPGSAVLAQNGVITGSDNRGTAVANALAQVRIGDGVTGGSPMPMLLKLVKYWSIPLPQDAALSYSEDLGQKFEPDNRPSISIQSTITIPVSSSTVSLLILLTGDAIGTVVSYATQDGTARAGIDYTTASGSIVMPAGANTAFITVPLLTRNDTTDRSFKIILSSATGATITNGICDVVLLHDASDTTSASTVIEFTGTLPAEMALTRTTVAWTRNSTGVWTSVGANAYRNHYLSPGFNGLLIEPEATEQLLYDSVDPGFTATAGTRTLVTSEQTPTGTRQVQFREDTSIATHKLSVVLSSANAVTPTGTFNTSVMIRPVNRQHFLLTTRGLDNTLRSAVIDLTGAGTVSGTGADLVLAIERDAFRPDWFSVSLGRGQSVAAGVPVQIEVACSLQGGSPNLQGESGFGFDLCHVQVEPKIGGSSPIIVTAKSARTVRAADILKAAGTWHQRQSYTLGVRMRRMRDTPAVQRLWMAKDVSGQNNGVLIDQGQFKFDVAGQAPLMTLETIGTDSQTVYPLPNSGTDGSPYALITVVGGLLQSTNTYTVAGETVTFSESPPLGVPVDFRAIPFAALVLEGTGTGTRTAFNVSPVLTTYTSSLLVAIDGVVQRPSTYSLAGDLINFSQAPPVGSSISIRFIGNNTVVQEATATTATTLTTFFSSENAASGVLLSIDGIIQWPSSYTAVGTLLVLSQATQAGAALDLRFLRR